MGCDNCLYTTDTHCLSNVELDLSSLVLLYKLESFAIFHLHNIDSLENCRVLRHVLDTCLEAVWCLESCLNIW